ncbi:MAG: hypothetical protein ACE5G5_06685 [Candidatus Methylomirabilales bacterium]
MSPDELFTREEALGGLPAKRATTLLFLIESRTAHLVDQSRRAMEFFVTEESAKERDLAFLEAFSLGREPPLRPTIQDLERHAPQWAPLVPDNPSVQAAVAHLLGQKYQFTYQSVPGIRAALGLDEKGVQQAYRRLYRESLETLYASRITLLDRLRWAWAAVTGWPDYLPPFWTTFVLTVALGLPPAILALPIAVANIGPVSGILLLLAIGLINVFTMACMAEACARSGAIRYGKAFVGRLTTDFLGGGGSFLLSLTLVIRNFLSLLAASVGLAITMLAFTHVPTGVWIALLFFIELYLLSRKTLKFTMTVLLLLAVINAALLLPIGIVAFTHARPESLLYGGTPLPGGETFDPEVLRLVVGVILLLYFGHVYVIHCAKVVLPRDPSGRSLIRGSVTGTACLTAIMAIWVVAIGGAIAPQVLASQAGTAITPLAEQVGPSIAVLGSALIIFFLGMSCIRSSDVLFNLVQERLPTQVRSIVMLPRRRGTLVLQQRRSRTSSPRLGLTYLGLADGQPHFRLDVQSGGNTHRVEVTVARQWDTTALLERFPELGLPGVSLALEIQEASPEGVRLQVSSPMSLTYEGDWDTVGLGMADALTLADPLRELVNWMMRRGEVRLTDVTAYTGQDQGIARTMMDALVEQDFVKAMEGGGEPRYRIRLAPKRGRQMSQDIWQALDAKVETPANPVRVSPQAGVQAVAQRIREMMLGERGRFFLSISPVLMTLLLAQWILVTGTASFAWLMSFSGVVTNSLAAGIFPVLLLISSRRKADLVPGVAYRFLGNPLVVATIYALFLAILFLHGLVIWEDPLARISAVLVGFLIIGVTIAMVRHGVFAPRIVVELREDQREEGRGALTITTGGQPAAAEVRLGYPEGEQLYQTASATVPMLSALRYATFHLPATSARELKVWAHKVTPDGGSESLPAFVEVHCGDETRRFDLKLSEGQVVLPLTSGACWLRMTLPEPSGS